MAVGLQINRRAERLGFGIRRAFMRQKASEFGRLNGCLKKRRNDGIPRFVNSREAAVSVEKTVRLLYETVRATPHNYRLRLFHSLA